MINKKYIYFIKDFETNTIKIGSSENPKKRLRELQTANPNNLKLLFSYIKENKNEERVLHDKFKEYHKQGEWFYDSFEIFSYILQKNNETNLLMKIIAYNKSKKELIDVWDKQTKEDRQEPYNFDSVHVDFEGKYVDFIDLRYYKEGKFHNKTVLAPIRMSFDELDFIYIRYEGS